MTAHPRVPGHAEPGRARDTISGTGTIIAVGRKPVPVTYEFSLATFTGHIPRAGLTPSRRSALEKMWLEPVVMLQMEDGKTIDISITTIGRLDATFELSSD